MKGREEGRREREGYTTPISEADVVGKLNHSQRHA